jgi:F-type H+-transporting ATPase subunit gamma
MTERLADIEARIHGVRQLGAVVNAMRGVAAARAQQAREHLRAVDGYAHTLAIAIGRALELVDDDDGREIPPPSAQRAIVVFTAEQGFAGAFSERVLDAVAPDLPGCEPFLVGTRGAVLAAARGIPFRWQAGLPAHPSGVPALADRIAEAVLPRVARGAVDRIEVVYGEWRPGRGLGIERRSLIPLDLRAFPRPARSDRPLVNLLPARLLAGLTEDYLHAQLCHAALHAFAAENEARMQAMASAHRQVQRQFDALLATQRRVRQDEITAEIVELAAGEAASALSPSIV